MKINAGPQTAAAKAVSSQNALQHGLTSQRLLIAPHQEEEFSALAASLRAELAPHGPLQEIIFHQLLKSAWNSRRCDAAELALAEETGADPIASPDPLIQRRLAIIHRYRTAHDRGFLRTLAELRALQTNAFLQQQIETRPALADELILARHDELQSRTRSRNAITEIDEQFTREDLLLAEIRRCREQARDEASAAA